MKRINATKQKVAAIMHPLNRSAGLIPGGHIDFYKPYSSITPDLAKRAEQNAEKWGWIDNYGRLTQKGYLEK